MKIDLSKFVGFPPAERMTITRIAAVIQAPCLPATAPPHQEDLVKLLSILIAVRGRAIDDAKKVADDHAQKARDNVAQCRDWSPAQAEWSRARDLALDISEAIESLKGEPT